VAGTLPRSKIAQAVRKATIVQALPILAIFPEISGVAHAAAHWEFNTAVTVEAAVVLAILDAAIFPNKGGLALAGAITVTDPVAGTLSLQVARVFLDVRKVDVVVGVDVAAIAAVTADLLLGEFVVVTKVPRATAITTIYPVKTWVTEAVPVVADPVVAAVVVTNIYVELPKVT